MRRTGHYKKSRSNGPQKPGRTIAYTRVSTDEQVRDGVSMDAQEARLKAFCHATGRENVELICDDGKSGKDLHRPGMAKLLEAVRAGAVDAVIILKMDRLTRSVRDLADILEVFTSTDTALVSVTESLDTGTAGGRLMLHLLASVSQWERETIAERTSFALAHMREANIVYGSTPFGYDRNDNTLVAVDALQDSLISMKRMHEQGATYREIAAWLESNGIKTARGMTRWHPNSVRQVLTSSIAQERLVARP